MEKEDARARHVKGVIPIVSGTGIEHAFTEVKKGEMGKGEEGGAYRKLRIARSDARLIGVREKRAKTKAEAEEAKKK